MNGGYLSLTPEMWSILNTYDQNLAALFTIQYNGMYYAPYSDSLSDELLLFAEEMEGDSEFLYGYTEYILSTQGSIIYP